MKRIKFLKNNQAAGMISAVVLVVTVLIGVIVSSVVFFAFAEATEDVTRITQTFTSVSGELNAYVNVTRTIDATDPDIDIETSTNGTWVKVTGNRTEQFFIVGKQGITSDTSHRITFNARGANEINNVVLYAITVFALLAIIPLIMVGGLMLKSLGFMSGGELV